MKQEQEQEQDGANPDVDERTWNLSTLGSWRELLLKQRRPIAELAPWTVVTVAVGYFVLLASLYLDRPGLYYDEVIFVPAALGGQYAHVGFVAARYHGIPVMIMTYIGALKSYLFAPIFALFGVSVATIRGPAIALSAITLVLTYLLGRQFLGRWSSAVLVLLMAMSPDFIFLTKVDWGPVALPMLLKIATLLAFFRLLHKGRIRYLWMWGALILLGTFDKVDFVWVLVAVSVAGATVYGRQLWEIMRASQAHVIVALSVLGVLGLELARKIVLPNLGTAGNSSLQNPFPHLYIAWNNYQGVLGEADLLGVFAGQANQPDWMALGSTFVAGTLLALVITWLVAGKLPPRATDAARAAIFFFIVFIIMLIEIAATKVATGPHHVIELWPFQDVILVGAASATLHTLWPHQTMRHVEDRFRRVPHRQTIVRWAATSGLALAGLALITTVTTQTVSTLSLVSMMQKPATFRPVFRTDVYRILGFIDANSSQVDEVVTANWGVGQQLFALACPGWRGKVRDDVWPQLVGAKPQAAAATLRAQFGNQRVLVVSINSASQTDLPPTLRVSPTVFKQAYDLLYPRRQPATVFATPTYTVTYFGPQEVLKGDSTVDRGCGTSATATAAPSASSSTVFSTSIWFSSSGSATDRRRRYRADNGYYFN